MSLYCGLRTRSTAFYWFSQGKGLMHSLQYADRGAVNDETQRNISNLGKLLSLLHPLSFLLINILFLPPLCAFQCSQSLLSPPIISPFSYAQFHPLVPKYTNTLSPVIFETSFPPLLLSVLSLRRLLSSISFPPLSVIHFMKLFNSSSISLPSPLAPPALPLSFLEMRERDWDWDWEEDEIEEGDENLKRVDWRGRGTVKRGRRSEEVIKEKETPERVPELNWRLNRINIELRDRKREGEKRGRARWTIREIRYVTFKVTG